MELARWDALDRMTTSPPTDNSSKTDVAGAIEDIVPRVLGGEVLTVRNVLRSIGAYEEILELVLAEIEEIAGVRVAGQIRDRGLERLHEHLAIPDLVPLLESIRTAMRPVQAGHVGAIVRAVLGWKGVFYHCAEPILRIHLPYDLVARSPEHLAEFRAHGGGGKLGPHDPHRDSWVNCPYDSINLWVAVGRVRVGNGICIWPQHFGDHMDSPERLRRAPAGHPGRPVNVSLDPGDVVVFHAEHLHGSELNWTDETRFALSYRVTLEPPRFPPGSRQVYLDSQVGEEFRLDEKARLPDRGGVGEGRRPRGGVRRVDRLQQAEGFEGGSIEPHSGGLVKVTLEGGGTALAGRYCTHEGADLCGGYVAGRQLVCPRHNLPFDLDSGASPCRTLASIEARRV
jgi:nitrite reductase/ring-hydroxylating ferredoxin subunit